MPGPFSAVLLTPNYDLGDAVKNSGIVLETIQSQEDSHIP